MPANLINIEISNDKGTDVWIALKGTTGQFQEFRVNPGASETWKREANTDISISLVYLNVVYCGFFNFRGNQLLRASDLLQKLTSGNKFTDENFKLN